MYEAYGNLSRFYSKQINLWAFERTTSFKEFAWKKALLKVVVYTHSNSR